MAIAEVMHRSFFRRARLSQLFLLCLKKKKSLKKACVLLLFGTVRA